ncbi:MAG TPA: hypothetical protein VF469_18445 [Kofleriaceae bacterium]
MPKFSLLKFKTLIRNDQGPAEAVNEVLHTQEDLDAYLDTCQDKSRPKHPVAFPEERAVAVGLGMRRQAGYVAEIIAVVQETGGFVGIQHHVLYVEHVPHGPSADVITYPHHVIRVRGLGGIVSFRQVPDTIGHSLRALTGQVGPPGMAALASGSQPTTAATGEEGGGPTTMAVGEEAMAPTTLATGEEGGGPTTMAVGEEGQTVTTLALGEEGPQPTTMAVGEEGQTVTTLALGEEGQVTAHIGEHATTLALGEEGQVTARIGEHATTLALGEEGLTTLMIGEEVPGHGGGPVGGGPFG